MKYCLSVFFVWSILSFNARDCLGQNYSKLEIYQYHGTDSANMALTKVCTFNEQGKITSEFLMNHYEGARQFIPKSIYLYYYKDTSLIEKLYFTQGGFGHKKAYTHDKQGRIIEEKYYEARSGVDYWDFLDSINSSDEYEKTINWKEYKISTYKYNLKGKLIEKRIEGVLFPNQPNRITYEYSNKGKLLKASSYATDDCLVYSDSIVYKRSEIRKFNFSYKDCGKLTKVNDIFNPEVQRYIHSYLYDKNRLLEEKVTDENGRILVKYVFNYKENAIVKDIIIGKNGDIEIVNIYKYVK